MPNTLPCRIHEYQCPCRNKNCTQNHPGMCVYYDTAPPGPVQKPSYYQNGSVYGMGADSVAADILQYMESDIADGDYFDGIGFGGGNY